LIAGWYSRIFTWSKRQGEKVEHTKQELKAEG